MGLKKRILGCIVQDLRGDSLRNIEFMPINERSYGSEFYVKLESSSEVSQRDYTGSTRFLVFLVCLGESELRKETGNIE